MRRTIAAVLIFAAALGFSACCEAYSLRVTQTLCSSAQAIKQQAQAGDFAAAEAALSQTEEYFFCTSGRAGGVQPAHRRQLHCRQSGGPARLSE